MPLCKTSSFLQLTFDQIFHHRSSMWLFFKPLLCNNHNINSKYKYKYNTKSMQLLAGETVWLYFCSADYCCGSRSYFLHLWATFPTSFSCLLIHHLEHIHIMIFHVSQRNECLWDWQLCSVFTSQIFPKFTLLNRTGKITLMTVIVMCLTITITISTMDYPRSMLIRRLLCQSSQ